jgi:hypothetical protein
MLSFVIVLNQKVRFVHRTLDLPAARQVWIYNLSLQPCLPAGRLSITIKHYRHYQHQHVFVLIAILW